MVRREFGVVDAANPLELMYPVVDLRSYQGVDARRAHLSLSQQKRW